MYTQNNLKINLKNVLFENSTNYCVKIIYYLVFIAKNGLIEVRTTAHATSTFQFFFLFVERIFLPFFLPIYCYQDFSLQFAFPAWLNNFFIRVLFLFLRNVNYSM
jgi:hypothetical protein